VCQWGEDFYIHDWDGSNRQLVYCVSYQKPANSISTWDEQDDYGVVFNSQGMYLLTLTGSCPAAFKRNSPAPQVVLEDNIRLDSKPLRYDYVYAMVRMTGRGIRNRTTLGVQMLQQTGTTKLQQVGTKERDHNRTWKEKPIGDGTKTQGRLICGQILPAYQTPTWWYAIAAPGGSYKLTVNDRTENFVTDFGVVGYNVTSMDDVAAAMEETVRLAFYEATCKWDGDNKRFIFTTGQQDGSTISYGAEGTGGTDISGAANMRLEDGAVVQNGYTFTDTNEIGLLTIPRIGAGNADPQEWHYTHYSVWRTEQIGKDAVDPRVDRNTGEVLQPLKFTWVYDQRVAGAFWAYSDKDGLITALVGEFEVSDEGSQFEWEDGTIVTLGDYIDSTHMTTRASGTEYYDQTKKLQAAAIGGGTVTRATQTDDIVTRISGDAFVAGDERRTLFSSTGDEMIITEYIDGDHVRVCNDTDKTVQGFTTAPTCRMFCDTITDEVLRARQGESHIGYLENRFWIEMPTASLGIIIPGFIITAKHNSSLIHYCQLGMSKKYMGGHYLPNRQVNDRVEDTIQGLWKLPTKFIVFCKSSTWGGPTNLSDGNIKKLPQFGYIYAVLYVDIIDDRIGCLDLGSVQRIDYGTLLMRCSDGAVRSFNGEVYSRDYTVQQATSHDIIKKQIYDSWPKSVSVYSTKNNLGYVIWTRKKAS
jgi:hypothetical protein